MANSVSVNTNTKDLWGGGVEPYKASYGKLMMWFFLISDAFTFSAFLIAYGVIRFRHPGYEGTLSDFSFSQTYWPVPEKVFEEHTLSCGTLHHLSTYSMQVFQKYL